MIAPDLPGIGGNLGPGGGYDEHSLASDVTAILPAEETDESVVLCRHNMGTYLAGAHGLDQRARGETLVTIDEPRRSTTYTDQLMANPSTWHIGFHSQTDVAHICTASRERQYINYSVKPRMYGRAAVADEEIHQYAPAYSEPGTLRSALEMRRALPRDRELNPAIQARDGELTTPVVRVGSSVKDARTEHRDMLDETTTDAHLEVVGWTGQWTPEEQPRPSSPDCRRRGAGTHRRSSDEGRDRRDRLAP
jgi:pimeloyl-ACP methyl ester carboxylesterase